MAAGAPATAGWCVSGCRGGRYPIGVQPRGGCSWRRNRALDRGSSRRSRGAAPWAGPDSSCPAAGFTGSDPPRGAAPLWGWPAPAETARVGGAQPRQRLGACVVAGALTPRPAQAPSQDLLAMRGKQIAWTAVIALVVVLGYDYAKAKQK